MKRDGRARIVLCSTVLVLVVMAGQTMAAIVRGPYLQNGTSEGVTIMWRTSSNESSKVWYGTSLGSLNLTVTDATSRTNHTIQITGLPPASKYYYQVGRTDGTVLAGGDADHYFVTSPVVGSIDPIRIWVLGDSGTANSNARAVRDAYLELAGNEKEADIWLMLGDNAYNSGTESEFQNAVFNTYPSILKNKVLWSTRGNHEANASVYYGIFDHPTLGEGGGLASGTESYYSFDYGNVHFICLNSEESGYSSNPGSAMYVWLEQDLADTTQDWIIAFWHHPPYSKGSHDSDSESKLIYMRQYALPILEAGGVDLVLSGHSHAYERSYFLNGHYGTSGSFNSSTHKVQTGDGKEDGNGAYQKCDLDGAVYIVAGSSGKLSGVSQHAAMQVWLREFGSLIIDVDNSRLDSRFLRETTGPTQIDDYFTIEFASCVTDETAPTPDPMEWLTVPYATGTTSISMTAATATDDYNNVEYFFACTAGGGNDSVWQSGSTYEDTGLTANREYTYQVFARDTSPAQNVTLGSAEESARTDIPEPGDLDDSGDVNLFDVYLFGLEWGRLDCLLANDWCGFADIAPQDGVVDGGDFGLLAGNYAQIVVTQPAVVTDAASDLTQSTAVLNGEITSTGDEDPTVTIYWGLTDQGTNAGTWDESENLGAQGLGAFSTSIGTLSANTTYYYRCYAANSAGGVWAPSTVTFDTLEVPSIWYSQDFDSIGAYGTAMPTGWIVGGNAYEERDPPISAYYNEALYVDNGSSNTRGRSYNYGSTGDSDRAVGQMPTSASGDRGIQVALVNDTGSPITVIEIYYTGEQWKDNQGTASNWSTGLNREKLKVYISDAANFSGIVEDLGPDFFFPCPRNNGGNVTLDGNLPANRVENIGGEYTLTTPIAAGATFYISWHDWENNATADHALAIDDVVITLAGGGGSVVEPEVVNDAASGITASTAVLNGQITSTGGENPTVTIYWGDDDAGITGPWDDSEDLGTQGSGAFSTSIGTLSADTTYYYRCYASNSAGGAWAPSTETFDTLVQGSVWFSENFDSIGPTGTAMPTGWVAGTSAGGEEQEVPTSYYYDEALTFDDGSSTTKGIPFNLGSPGSSDRAIGQIPTSSQGDGGVQVALTNDTGQILTSIEIRYTGEQWKDYQAASTQEARNPDGSINLTERLIMFISDKHDFSGYAERLPVEFDFSRLHNTPGSTTVLDGNLPANRTENIGGEYTFVNPIPVDGVFYITWHDFESDATNDHILAIDDVVITLPGISSLDEYTEDFETGWTNGARIETSADWYSSTGPQVSNSVGVAGSKGLTADDSIFTWTAHPFKWSDLAVGDVVIMGMDFEAIGTSPPLDDDRVGWMIKDDSTHSNNIFGTQADPGGSGNNVECYWDGDNWGDNDGRKSILNTSLVSQTWYRMTSTFTKLTDTSCRVDVEFVDLDSSGNPIPGTLVTGSIPDTAALNYASTTEASPRPEYFDGLPGYSNTLWPAFKNHQGGTGNADNAYFAIGTP